jgi:uncharacterized membrane protein
MARPRQPACGVAGNLQKNPVYGWTVNFASRSGVLALIILLALPIFITVFTLLTAP